MINNWLSNSYDNFLDIFKNLRKMYTLEGLREENCARRNLYMEEEIICSNWEINQFVPIIYAN